MQAVNFKSRLGKLIAANPNRVAVGVCVGVILVLLTWQFNYVAILHNGLSPKANEYSEANAIRAGQDYAENGFFTNYGLPATLYGNQFPDFGHKPHSRGVIRRPGDRADSWVYIHYPPGPDLMVGLLTKVLGLGHVSRFRLWPILVGIFFIAFFSYSLFRNLGAVRGAAMTIGCAVAPMFSNMMHGLHYQGYAFALMLGQFALLMDFARSDQSRLPIRKIIGLGIIGFLQGWLSFDYFFVVSFSAIPFWLWRWFERDRREPVPLVICIAAPAIGFGLAHLFHFFQVALLLGSIHLALEKFMRVAAERTSSGTLMWNWLVYANLILFNQWIFSVNLLLTGLLIVYLLLFPRGCVEVSQTACVWGISWKTNRKLAWAVASAFIVSGLWISIAQADAIFDWHPAYRGRHFFLAYFFCLLFVVTAFHDPRFATKESPALDTRTIS